jgi:hypothetical protein
MERVAVQVAVTEGLWWREYLCRWVDRWLKLDMIIALLVVGTAEHTPKQLFDQPNRDIQDQA